MNKKKPSYDELEKRLAEAEELLAKIRKNETNTAKSERNAAVEQRNIAVGERDTARGQRNTAKGEFDTVIDQRDIARVERDTARDEREMARGQPNLAMGERDTAILDTEELAKAYLASEQNFKNSMDTCPLGVRIVTEDGALIYANKAALDIFGYHTVEELAAVKRQELYTPESYAAYQERKKKRKLKQYIPGEYELSIRRPDGNVRDLLVFRREVMWGGEKQYMAMYEDITERKKVEEALRESEEKYHSLIEHSNDGIIYIQEGLIQYCNSKMLEIGGYTTEEIYGKPFTDFIVPEQKESVAEIYRKRIAGLEAPERYELDFISKGGSVINTEISASLFYYRQKLMDIAILRDITDRKKMDEALKESEREKAAILNGVLELVTYQDRELRLIWANKAAGESVGESPEKLLGRHCYEIWQNRNEPCVGCPVAKCFETGRPQQTEMASPDGRIWFVRGYPVRDEKGNVIGATEITLEITERKRAEEELKSREKFLDSIIEKTPSALWVSDEKGTLIRINQALRNMLLLTDEEIIGKYNVLKDSQVIEQGFLPLVKCVYDEGKTVSFTLDYQTAKENQVKPAQTTHKVLEIVMSAIKNEEGKVINVICQEKDITEQEKAKEASRESEARFRTLFETMAQGVVYQEASGKIISANPAAQHILGLTVDQMLGRTSTDPNWKSIHEDDTDFPGEEHPSMVALRTGKPLENVVMGVFNPIVNEHRWILVNAIPEFRKGEKTPYRAYTTFTDITEQKKAEQALRESEERYRLLFENSKDAILLTSPEGGILAVNPQGCRMFGRTEKEICRIGRSGVIDASDPRLASALEKRRLTGEFSGELTGIRADDTRFPIDLSTRIFYDKDGKARTSMIIRDITERKQAEEALRESEEKYRVLTEKSAVGVYFLQGSKIPYVNPSVAKILGYKPEEIIGVLTLADLIHPDDIKLVIQRFQERLEGVVDKGNIIYKAIKKDGSLIYIETYSTLTTYKGRPAVMGTIVDVTERKVAEEALRKSEERLRSIFSAAPVGIGMAVKRVFTEVNENFCKMVGYTRDELIGQPGRMVYPDDQEYDYVGKEQYRQLAAKGTGTAEFRLRRKDGAVLNVLLSASALDPDDLSRGVTFTALDITERKRAEEAIKESEERFNTAFHASPNMMAVISLEEGRFIDVNAEHTRITGYERREVIGKTTLEVNLWAHPEKREEFYRIINTEGRLKDYEILMRTKSGEIRTLLFSAEKIMLRGINCMVVSALDITERKEAEERINHLNLTLHSIRNVNQLITREKDRSLLIQKVCDSLVESQSFKSAWIVLLDENQQPVMWAGANVSKDFPDLIESMKQGKMPNCIQKALKQKKVVITEDPHTMCKGCPVLGVNFDVGTMTNRLEIEGKLYGVLCATIPKKLINDKEELSLFTEIATDIAFALRDIELVAANNLREQESLRMAKMESIGMLAGGIAHDFNNLLTGIMGNIGLVKTYISTSDPTYEMLDEAEIAAVRARDLTQQLLTFTKGGKPVKKLINTTEIIKESADFALRGSKAKLTISFPDDLWQIEADEGQIGQVINNLVINADEAMPAGGTLQITAENLALKKSDALPVRGGNYVRIEIKDTGIGISPKHIQRIFEPYFTTKQKGSGLGLTTAYSIAKNHGGIILVESVPNEGSTFHIYLPAKKKALKGAKKLTVDESGQAGGKVLIMDDEEIIRKMLKNMLSMAGYTVELSADGTEALKKYEQAIEARDPFNAVIMDLTIPGGMGGKEAVKKLLEIDPKALVIVSSGYATDPIMSDYKKYGFKAVIAKPYSVKQIRDLLSRLLTKKKR